MSLRLHLLALRLYRRLPTLGRRWLVRTIAPSFTVGAMVFIERADGDILLVRHIYRQNWGVPGGLLKRGEDAADGARREVFEEVGLAVDLVGEPTVAIDADPQRVDVIYRGRPTVGADPDSASPRSPEIVETRWFSRESLPDLQHETSGALIRLARASRSPSAHPLPPT
ncbi:MAG: NUDIX domain-containing protein [Aquihabitans sp.]